MRLLADENVPRAIVDELRSRGHDLVWVRATSPGISDPEVLTLARAEARILLTFDKDFGELAFRQRLDVSPGVVLVRLLLPPEELARRVAEVLESRDDWSGQFSVVEQERVRMVTPVSRSDR